MQELDGFEPGENVLRLSDLSEVVLRSEPRKGYNTEVITVGRDDDEGPCKARCVQCEMDMGASRARSFRP